MEKPLIKVKSSAPFLFCSLCMPIIFILYVSHVSNKMTLSTNQDYTPTTINNDCDLFEGGWVWDERGSSSYTNHSCKTLPYSKNCLLHGRKDTDFLHWRWKPHNCELPRLDAKMFMATVQGKTMAFIGDSVARNQMESLLCLLSQDETPIQKYKDEEDRFVTWRFPRHNFTLMVFWSQFLVTASERFVNGSSTGGFDLQLDKVDVRWSKKLPSFDYAILSGAHWFYRQNYLYEGGKLIGCVYCGEPNVTVLGPEFAIRRAFRAAYDQINGCQDCSGLVTFLRTYSPDHFEHGTWDHGGGCNRTRPFYSLEEDFRDSRASDWEYRKVQVEEVERARRLGEGKGIRYEVIDVTRAMMMRPDGHPDVHWSYTGHRDCVHWCLPGPIDTWNEVLLSMLILN